jgi:aryl-alcohol dehydrogenase-like predicted oxidoreductase
MDALVAEGKVRVKGQSAYSTDDFERAIPVVKPAALQSWAHALDDQFVRPGARLQELMAEHNCTFVAFSPLAQGRLLDKFDPSKPPTFEPGDHRQTNSSFGVDAITALKPKLELLKARFGSTTEDLSSIAQRYILNMDNVACVIPGFRNEAQVRCNLSAVNRTLTAEDVQFIKETLR